MKTDLKYIWDMLDAAQEVQEYISNRSYQDFVTISMLRSAVERKIEIIGEAANRVSTKYKQLHPEISWKKIIAQRHVLAHDYGDIKYELLWQVATEGIPELIALLKPLMPQE